MIKLKFLLGGKGLIGLTMWREITEALEKIVGVYERVNHVISLYQDDRARERGLELIDELDGVAVELGTGPGNFAAMLLRRLRGPLICLDYSAVMIREAKGRLKGRAHLVRGVFEALPVRGTCASLSAAAYSLRDSKEKLRVMTEVAHILKVGGEFLIVDVGKPENPVFMRLLSLYLRWIVPILAGLWGGQGPINPWRMLYDSYTLLPSNGELLRALRVVFGMAELEERAHGGLIVAVAHKVTRGPNQNLRGRARHPPPHASSSSLGRVV
jgi:demethylmenaquinone methyltransferase/2-methoxy-6-polyprenyl-1,4-benzoquinol methylase